MLNLATGKIIITTNGCTKRGGYIIRLVDSGGVSLGHKSMGGRGEEVELNIDVGDDRKCHFHIC